MDKCEIKKTKTQGFWMGYILAAICGWCITLCISMGVIAATIKLILWMLRM